MLLISSCLQAFILSCTENGCGPGNVPESLGYINDRFGGLWPASAFPLPLNGGPLSDCPARPLNNRSLGTGSYPPGTGFYSRLGQASFVRTDYEGGLNVGDGAPNEDLLLHLVQRGPVAVCIQFTRQMKSYTSGIYDVTKTCAGHGTCTQSALVIGYGDDPVGGLYWKVRFRIWLRIQKHCSNVLTHTPPIAVSPRS